MSIRFDKNSDRIKLNELESLSKNLKRKLDSIPEEPSFRYSGLMGRRKTEPTPLFNEAECETVYQGQNNSWIVMGRDRPGPIGSGYGGIGATGASSIDFVVGRTGREARNVDDNDVTIVADNDFKSDAARIYISERTDIDINFGIVPGRIGSPTGRSGIGIKADNVRIVAREGIKLITRTDDTNSKGGNTDVILGVDIIAGNDDSDLQPMVKGTNLVQLLKYMIDDSRRLAQMIQSLSLSQGVLETMLAAHTHSIIPDPTSETLLGAAPSKALAVTVGASQIKRIVSDIPSQIMHTFNNIAEEIEFLEPYGTRYINSRSNHVN